MDVMMPNMDGIEACEILRKDQKFNDTIKKIDDLVEAFKGTKDSFTRVAESLEESANILKKTDPAE